MISRLPRRKAPLAFYVFTVISQTPDARSEIVRAKCRSDEIATSQARMLARNYAQSRGFAVEVRWQDSAGEQRVITTQTLGA